MIWFAVLWISWTCPGGPASRLIPAALRPAVCAPAPAWERFSRRGYAEYRVRELGAGSRLYACRGLRCSDNLADWTDVKFKEAP